MAQADNIPELSPPDGDESWLEYAVATFDARNALAHRMFDDRHHEMRQHAQAAAWAELNRLREKAGQRPRSRP